MDREPKTHDLKCWAEPFGDVASGRKKFEVRINDRDYQVGDTFRLHRWDPVRATYTGAMLGPFRITYVCKGLFMPTTDDGDVCAFAFEPVQG